MIEHENQTLRIKNDEIKQQLAQKKANMIQEQQTYLAKIARLQKMRDEVMDRYIKSNWHPKLIKLILIIL